MLRKVLLATVIGLAVVIAVGFYLRLKEPVPAGGDLIVRQKQVEDGGKTPINTDTSLPPVVKEINDRNAAIGSFSCDDLEIKVWQSGHRYRLTGVMYYEKPKNFRLQIDSIMGRELDLGSNQDMFWYWSRRDKNPGLHYAKHEDFIKTKLKTPFNPIFMKATLGLEVFEPKNAKFTESDKDVMITYAGFGGTGRPVLYSAFVNKDKKRIDGYLVTDEKGKVLVSCEIQEHSGYNPKSILYTWYEEDKVMLMKFGKTVTNPKLKASYWGMPDYKPQINMVTE